MKMYLVTPGVSRQDSRLSVKSLIESIENAAKAAKQSPATTPVTEWPQVAKPIRAFLKVLLSIFIHCQFLIFTEPSLN